MESILDKNETETSAKSDNQNTATDGNESSKEIEEINIEKKVSFTLCYYICLYLIIYTIFSLLSMYNIVIRGECIYFYIVLTILYHINSRYNLISFILIAESRGT